MNAPTMKLMIGLLTLTLISSCSTPTEKNLEAGAEQEVMSVSEKATWIDIDTASSVVTWIGSKPKGQHNGIIPFSTGQLAVLNNEIVGGKFEMAVQRLQVMDLMKDPARSKKLKDHLMSEDFFEADSFPTASFEIVEVTPFDSAALPKDIQEFESEYTPATLSSFMVANPTHLITGNLTLRGVTRSITFPADISFNPESIRAEAKFNIDRTDWNLSYSDEASVIDKAKDRFIYNTVNVGLNLEVTR
jgi:polyisoprenoid-binding protein YceI